MNYDAIAFKNRDIDKFSTKFGKDKTDPEKEAAKDAMRTKGMTENQKNLYNLKGELGQRMYAKKVAKENVKAEANKSSSTASTVNEKPKKPTLTVAEKETKKTNRGERVNKGLTALGTLASSILGGVALVNNSKKNNNNTNS